MKGKSAGGLIDYLNSMKEKNAKVIFSNGVSTTSNRTVVAAFNLQWANSSSKIKDKMGHLVISFSPKDRERLTDEFITARLHPVSPASQMAYRLQRHHRPAQRVSAKRLRFAARSHGTASHRGAGR